ncbi:dorsal-ventral patterning tolloid-like protein 1 [Cotesia glomerata]|uniref:dorsal-ventral patterning tolloid-like protein 1 n=1 Tax=Cotesia glomerata TaxID=32391 RepID=UPI001D00DC04|nr:dorsal-ventral patterning tolloid-like protein 1 [Cotesia glomerata]
MSMDLFKIFLFFHLISSIVLIGHMHVITNSDKEINSESVGEITSVENIPETNKVKKTVAIKDREHLWTLGVIPYEIENNFTESQRRIIKLGMRIWEESTCIKFVERNLNTPDFIAIVKEDCGCCYIENIQRNKGRSVLSLDDGCDKLPIVLHELGHVVGFYHEHEHPDRDLYVQIMEHNVERGHRQEFGKYSHDEVDTLGQPYDYRSIMHYPKNAFARSDFMETIIPLQPDNGTLPVLGNRARLSAYDIAATNHLYKCPTCGGFLTNSSGSIELPENNSEYCEWRIRVGHGERISLRIESMDIQSTADCKTGYVEVQVGFNRKNSQIFGPYCGQTYDYRIIATESIIVSYVNTNKNISSKFKAVYLKICDAEISLRNNQKTYLESPNYPKNYKSNEDCLWHLKAQEDHVIQIQFDFFSLEPSNDCVNDYFRVGNGYKYNSSIIGTYCGTKNPWTITSQDNSAYIKFVSNPYYEHSGFSASITAIPNK